MSEFTTLATGLSFTECPRWRDGRLYLSDMYTHRVLAISMDGATELIARVPQPSGLGFLPDGRLLIVSMRERKILRRDADGSLSTYADLYSLAPWHLNDMLVDRDGRAWVGNFGFDLMGNAPARSTVLICVAPGGASSVAARDLGFPNGMVLTPEPIFRCVESVPDLPRPRPDGLVALKVSAHSGLVAGGNEPDAINEWFLADHLPADALAPQAPPAKNPEGGQSLF